MSNSLPLRSCNPEIVSLFWKDMPPGLIAEGAVELAGAVAGASPFLRQLMLRDPAYAGRVFSEDPKLLLVELLASLNGFTVDVSQTDVMRYIRPRRGKASATMSLVTDEIDV